MELSGNKLRKSALNYYKSLLVRQKRDLYQRTIGSNAPLKAYFEELQDELKSDFKTSNRSELINESLKSSFILFGNFRTDNQVREEFVRLLDEVRKIDPGIIVAIDWIPYEKRTLVDKFIKGRITQTAFVKKIWGKVPKNLLDITSYIRILTFAKKHRIKVLPVELEKSSGTDFFRRDSDLASKLASFYLSNRKKRFFILVPDSWICRNHLPRALFRALIGKEKNFKTTRVFSGSDDIYLRLASKHEETKTILAKSANDSFVFNLTPPVSRYNKFFNAIEEVDEISNYRTRYQGFYKLLGEINRKLKLKIDLARLKYRLFTDFEPSFIEHILSSEFLTKLEKENILSYVSKGRSYFIPIDQTIHLYSLSRNDAAEEGAHYIRYILAGLEKPNSHEDKFYICVVNEALAFAVSKILIPDRKPLNSSSSNIPRNTTNEEKEAFEIHSLGYKLGEKIFNGIKAEKIKLSFLREALSRRMTAPGEPRKFYNFLLSKTNG
jgi:hypothetical protein